MTNPRPTTREGRKKGPECGATNREGNPCQKPAGWGTNHPGEGRCKLHGGVGQKPSTRYADLRARPRLRELIERFAADDTPSDLSHELTLLRALVTDYVERYDAITEAVIAWHASFNGDFEMQMRRWRADVAAYLEEADNERAEPSRPFPTPPYPTESKPRQMVDITAAAGLIDKIGSMSDRIEKRRREGTITLATLDRIMEQLGSELVAACQEVRLDSVSRAALLATTERRWGSIQLDNPGSFAGPAPRPDALN